MSCFGNRRRRNRQISQPIKIEPKTFFANERTFLQWFNSAVFVATGGLTIAEMSESKTTGILLVTISVCIILYSMFVYYGRNRALLRRDTEGYNDIYGPLILSGVIIVSFIFSLIYI